MSGLARAFRREDGHRGGITEAGPLVVGAPGPPVTDWGGGGGVLREPRAGAT